MKEAKAVDSGSKAEEVPHPYLLALGVLSVQKVGINLVHKYIVILGVSSLLILVFSLSICQLSAEVRV